MQFRAGVIAQSAMIAWRSRGLIASRMFAPYNSSNSVANTTNNYTEFYEQSRHYAAVDAANISLVWQNVDGSSGGTGVGFSTYQVKAALFAAATNAAWQDPTAHMGIATWASGTDSSHRSPDILPGNYLESQQFAVSGIQAGWLLVIRNDLKWAVAPSHWPASYNAKFYGDEVENVGISLTERISPFSTDWAGGYYSYDVDASDHTAPALILGNTTTKKARVLILGDSISIGSGDSDQGNQDYAGWCQKLLGSNYPWYSVGQEGFALDNIMSAGGSAEKARRFGLADVAGITHVLGQLNTNDLSGGKTGASLYAQYVSLQAYLNTLPLRPRLILSTPTPHTNSGNTAVASDYAERKNYDALVRANNGVGYGFIDCSSAYVGGNIATSGLWDTAGGKGTATDGFGIHPNKSAVTAIVSANSGNLPTLLSVNQYY